MESIFYINFVLVNTSFNMYAQYRPAGKEGDLNVYIIKSFRKKKGDKTSSIVVKKLGRLSKIAQEHPGIDPREWVEQIARELTEAEKADNESVTLKLSPLKRIPLDKKRILHGGDILLLPLFYELGLDQICQEITSRSKFQFDLTDIMKKIVFGRILFPDSKLGTWRESQNFIQSPKFDLSDIYPALGVMARESDFIQAQLYHNSMKTNGRNTTVIYYDCSNYYFEVEDSDMELWDLEPGTDDKTKEYVKKRGLRKYGHSKENRPNPIVQLGLFMDSDGWPLAFCINPGNTAETQTMEPLEEKLADNFNLSTFVCCTDCGLGSRSNRKYNTSEGREYITVQSLRDKKIDPVVQKWALEDAGWHIAGHEGEYTIAEARELLGDKFHETTLFKDRWYKVGSDQFEEHYVITYSQKYADYTKATREKQVARALKKIENGETIKTKSPNDCRRFIAETSITEEGEVAGKKVLTLDEEKIKKEARFDGLYALATSLKDPALAVIKANSFRYEIEHLFRITKTDLELRPIYLSRTDRIIGHFITCFIALLLLKMFQQRINDGLKTEDQFSVEALREQLSKIKYLCHEAYGYEPSFDRNHMTDRMREVFNKQIDTEIIPKPRMRAMLRKTTKR